MDDVNQSFDVSLGFLKVLADVQLWESSSSPLLQSVAGRQLYFGLIRHIAQQSNESFTVESMKEIYYDKGINLTERGVRLTIRAFEADGIVVVERAARDRRSRRIFLTKKLQEQMFVHAMVMKRAMETNFLVIKK